MMWPRNLGLSLAGVLVVLAVASAPSASAAGGFYVYTDMLGYRGTVQNLSRPANTYNDSVGPWSTHDPRLATLYVSVGSPNPDINCLQSSWSEHSPSNQIDSFFALFDSDGTTSVDTATAGWDAATHQTFTVDVTGSNSAYPNSQFWQPDVGIDYGVNIISYAYHFTATFPSAATLDPSGLWLNTGDPTHITGTCSGQFIPMFNGANNPMSNGDFYAFALTFDSDWFTTNGGSYPTILPYVSMAGPEVVPEPATIAALGLGIFGVILRRPRRRQNA